jgi:VWFA-related protein
MRLLVCGGLAAFWSLSQATLPQPGTQPRPTFRSGTRLVEVSVVVHDKYRKPLSGLTADDFRLYDADREQRIEFFSVQSDRLATSADERALALPNEFSNRLQGGILGGVTVILFDRLNTSWENQVFARRHVLKFLEQIDGTDRIGLYLLDGDAVRVIHDFTSDTGSLSRALARYRATSSIELTAGETAAMEAAQIDDARLDAELGGFLTSGASRMAEHFGGLRAQTTIEALETVANRLAGIKGRKNLIWVSAGFPLKALEARGLSMSTEISRLTRALNNANVATYGVDARGLIGAFAGPPGRAGPPSRPSKPCTRTSTFWLSRPTRREAARSTTRTTSRAPFVGQSTMADQRLLVLPFSRNVGWELPPDPRQSEPTGVEVRHRRGYVAAVASTRRCSPISITARRHPEPDRGDGDRDERASRSCGRHRI